MLASPSSINIPLLQSAVLGDLPLLKKLLSEEGVDINTTDEIQHRELLLKDLIQQYGWTALHLAVGMDHLEVAQYLLNHGADPALKSKVRIGSLE